MRPAEHMEAPTPREHGAWGILIQSFVAGALLARNWTWLLLPAAGLALLGFLIKDPLIVFVRERWIWKRPGSSPKWLLIEGTGLALCFGTLLPFLPVLELALLGAAAAGLTAVAVWFTVHNGQRSIWLQLLSSAGLCSAALLAILASRSELPGWAWILWALLALHASAIIPVVHARLRKKATSKRQAGEHLRRVAIALQFLAAATALSLPAAPVLFSAAANLTETWRLGRDGSLAEPLKSVGLRLLAVSIVHTLLAVWSLWR